MALDHPSKKHPNANVLLVGPKRQLRRHLQEIITENCGCTTLTAATASGAVMKMNSQNFDLVLTDLSLPDADGKWLVQKIHQQRPHTSVIVLSDDSSAQIILDALRAGADDFLAKPLDDPTLVERVNFLLAGTKRNRNNPRWRRRTAAHLKRLRSRRQRLADQVELVCQDLVGGYRRTVEKLLEFQTQQDCRDAIQGQLQLKSLLGSILRYLSDTFGGASGAIFIQPFTAATARLFTTVGGGPPANIDDYDQTLINGIIQRSLQSGTAMLGSYTYDLHQAAADASAPDFADTSLDSPPQSSTPPHAPRSLLATGLYIRRQPIAAVVLQRRRQDPFTQDEAKLLANLAGPLAGSIDLSCSIESNSSYQSDSPQNNLD